MVSRILLAAIHLALAAGAFIEDAGSTGSALRQYRLRLPRKRHAMSLLANASVTLHVLPPSLSPGTTAGDLAHFAFAVSQKDDPEEVERLEKMVTDLVKEGGKHKEDKNGKATPMGPSVQYVKAIIDDTMLPNRERAHRDDQNTIDAAARRLESCREERNEYLARAVTAKASYKSASKRHEECRHTEAGERWEQSSRCRPEMLKVKKLQTEMTCAKVEEAQRCKYIDYQKIIDAEAECDRAKESERAAHELCDMTDSRYQGRKSQCDALQRQMDDAACKHAVQMKEACSEGQSCFNSKLSSFRATRDRVKRDEATRRSEWRALKRMQCLVAAFDNGKVEDSEIEDCKARTHEPPSIVYPETPSIDSCIIPDKYPGTSAYKEAEFKHLPPEANGNPDRGSCYGMDL